MSVPKSERGLSEMEFYYNATKLRRMMIELLLKDFGMKHKIRTVKRIGSMYEISAEDKQTLQDIMTKYEMDDSVIDEYPSWRGSVERYDNHFRLEKIDEYFKSIFNMEV